MQIAELRWSQAPGIGAVRVRVSVPVGIVAAHQVNENRLVSRPFL